MKRQTKKLVLPLLLSAVMIGSNVCYVCAQGQIADLPTGGDVSAPNVEAAADVGVQSSEAAQPVQSEAVAQPETPAQTEQAVQPEAAQPEAGATTQPEDGAQSGETTQPENGTQTEGTVQPEESTEGDGENGTETVAPEQGSGSEEGTGTKTDVENPDAAEGGELPDDAAAADGAGEVPEEAFVNQNGEAVLPSTLVGVDYNTISEIYDGDAKVQKQYMISDAYAKDAVISCSVDENGNLIMVISLGAPESEAAAEEDASLAQKIGDKLGSVFGDNTSAPAVDGSFTGWDDVPASYEFNWNKPDAWVDGVHYTETNSTDVRHEMKLYSDGENVYLRVIFAREFCNGQVANGNDYQFWIDDQQMAAYQVEWPDGTSLSNSNAQPGVYQVDVRHRDSSWSYVLTDGAVAYYRVNDGNLNNELELKIPLSEFVKQNENINLDNYSMISFFTPNLMQGMISTAGASTGAEPFAAAVFLLVPTSYVWIKKKDKKEMAFA